jgi:ribosomal-protein-alanine N-acetyltransferase
MNTAPALIEGARVRLRQSASADSQAVFLAAADPDVMRFLDWPAHKTENDALSYLQGCAARWAMGTEYHWIIEDTASGSLLGCIACRVNGHAADFGYFLARSAWGKGIATEAAGLLLSWLKRQPEILRIWAMADFENTRSISVLQRVGLQREGVLRMATYRPNIGGPPRDTAIYAYCRSDVGRG